jgi:hypothetical protein
MADTGSVDAELHLIEADGAIAVKLREALARGMHGLFGLSIDAVGTMRAGRVDDRTARIATKITKIRSVDLIVEPGAGGQVIKLIESQGNAAMDELSDILVVDIIEASKLPPAIQKHLKAKFKGKEVSESALREAIADARTLAATFTDSGAVRMGDLPARVEVLETQADKYHARLDAFFDPEHKDHRRQQSIRDLYLDGTGDRGFTGNLRNCDQRAMRESLDSTSWPEVLGDSISPRLIAEYRRADVYGAWTAIVNRVPRQDFRVQRTTRFGGYGDLPIVAQGAAYLPLASPTDEEATYSLAKRGGTEDLTMEMIVNDDVAAVRRVPTSLVRSAKRTVSKFVFDFLRTNPVIYDGIVLFHATHGNIGSVALDATSLAARRLAMKQQQELSSADRLGIPPRFLIVPDELEEAAVNLFRKNTNNDKNFVQSLTLDIIPVWYWTDATDWCLAADPLDIPSIEIGFLGGQEEPELFIQDLPNVGSMFSNDKVTYKIRHVYGGNVTDFRGLDKSVVAG